MSTPVEPAGIDRVEMLRRYERRMQLMVPADPEYLKQLPIFAGIPEKARDKVVEKVRKYMHLVSFNSGDVVLREGDYGDSAYYILEGAAEVLRPGQPGEGAPAQQARVRSGAHVPPAQRVGAVPAAAGFLGRGGTGGTVILSAYP